MFSLAWIAFRTTVGGWLKDWRVVAAILIGIVAIIMYAKFAMMQHNLTKANEAVVAEQQRAQVLQSNLNTAVKVNTENEAIVSQLKTDKANALNAVSKLNSSLQQTNESVAQIKDRINELTVAPSPLTPYLVEAVKGVQTLRDAEQAPEVKQ